MKPSESRIQKTPLNIPPEGASLEVNEMGEVKVHENVISALVRQAVSGVDGVMRLAGSTLMDNIAEIVGSRKMQDRSISVNIEDGGRVSLDVKVNLKFGYKIPVVTTAIQKAVIENGEQITGMVVTRVNVIVQELEMEAPAEADDEVSFIEPMR